VGRRGKTRGGRRKRAGVDRKGSVQLFISKGGKEGVMRKNCRKE
jgi:hypothetical protein